ncbi:hypothetical protein NDU88_007306 [Pleurodeles waltl]|uniref:Uncharacterized protein n=1 Tax=Pleurodeles waltl TaxID=8319 RepID=A0AAV7MGJ9_PLEWA|nr:hypothetical protein NDU88_007306 [Pleurodeles waltl]
MLVLLEHQGSFSLQLISKRGHRQPGWLRSYWLVPRVCQSPGWRRPLSASLAPRSNPNLPLQPLQVLRLGFYELCALHSCLLLTLDANPSGFPDCFIHPQGWTSVEIWTARATGRRAIGLQENLSFQVCAQVCVRGQPPVLSVDRMRNAHELRKGASSFSKTEAGDQCSGFYPEADAGPVHHQHGTRFPKHPFVHNAIEPKDPGVGEVGGKSPTRQLKVQEVRTFVMKYPLCLLKKHPQHKMEPNFG